MRKTKHDEILNNFIYEYEYCDYWELRYELWVDSNVLKSYATWEFLWFDELKEHGTIEFNIYVLIGILND